MVMRVLLDEQLDQRLRIIVGPEFQVETVRYRGWDGLADGELLHRAAAEYDALVTIDRGIPHQQNVARLSLGMVVLVATSNRRADTAPLIPAVCDALRSIRAGQVLYVPE
jgi:predicted nuclease of predicted toxin-antitoxin system